MSTRPPALPRAPGSLGCRARAPAIWASVALAALATCRTCRAETPAPAWTVPRFAFRIDNDFLAGTDAQYSSGLALAYAWPAHAQVDGQGHWTSRNQVFGLQQSIYTPEKNTAAPDRPYAATLVAAWSYNLRTPDRLSSLTVAGGVIGPSAKGEQVQNGFHRLFGSDRRQGWDEQVNDRLLLNADYQWLSRGRSWPLAARSAALVYGGGASLGNLRDEVHADVQVRWSRSLPEDFGSVPSHALGTALAPAPAASMGGHAPVWSLFGTIGRNWYDAPLASAPAHGPRRIDAEPWRWQWGGGLELRHGRWRLDAALVLAGPEYRQQAGPTRYVQVLVRRDR